MPIQLREHDIEEIMRRFKAHRRRHAIMDSCRRVAEDMGIDVTTIYSVQKRMRPTTEVATQYLKSQSLKLAMRVVRKANVEQAMNILSRPNIGVLDAPTGGTGGGGHQFMVGVAIDSLGSVRVGVQIGESQPAVREIGPSSNEGAEEAQEVDAEVTGAEDEESDDVDEEKPKRVWHQRDPKIIPPAPVPFPEGRSDRGPGTSLQYRLAQANAERKEAGLARRREKKQVSNRAKELAAQLAAVRNQK